MKKHLIQFVMGFAVAVFFLGHAAKVYDLPSLSALDDYFYDVRLRMTLPGRVDERIVILDLDEKSLAEVGRWPWNRKTMADLVNRLFDRYGVAVLGFDVIFAEPDASSGLTSLEELARTTLKDDGAFGKAVQGLRGSLDYDKRFADALRGRPVVLAYSFTNHDPPIRHGVLPPPAVSDGTFRPRASTFMSWNGYGANLAEFQAAAASAGFVNAHLDSDGMSRSEPLLAQYEGKYYESLPLAMARVLLGNPLIVPGYQADRVLAGRDYGELEWLDLAGERGTVRIPVDNHVASLIPYRGPERSFRYISAADVLKGRIDRERLRGKIVIVGSSAPGQVDLRATPVGSSYPGVEIHANMLAGMLEGAIKASPYVAGAEAMQVSVCALLLVFLLPILSPLRATLLALGVSASVVGINLALWSSSVAMPLGATLMTLFGLYLLNMSWGYFVESRNKRKVTKLFGQYVPRELVDKMADDPDRYSMEGRNEELTVLFADVRRFTSISEGMDPKELTHMMNEYLDAMTRVIHTHRGTLDKYIGDAIMVFWGAPVADADHARHAVLTALEMQQALRRLDPRFRERGWPILRVGIGINTGIMTVGDMGSQVRRAYTVIGDAVNLGSRLEGLTKEYQVGIIVSEATRMQAKDIVYRELDRVEVKGRDEAVAIFEPLGEAGSLGQAAIDELGLWDAALQRYRARDWDVAEATLRALIDANPDCHLYRVYLDRLGRLRADPPGQGWDGVTRFDAK